MALELVVNTGIEPPKIGSVWYPGEVTNLLPLRRVRVLPVPISLKLKAPISPREAL